MKQKNNFFILFLRSLLFSMIMTISTFFYSFVCVLSYPLPTRWRYAVVTVWTRWMIWNAKTICGIQYRVTGKENILKENGIILSKHQSTWETFFLPTLFHQPAIILKKQLLWVPFFGWGLAAMSPIAIDRKNKRSAMAQILKKGNQCIQQGRWILIFPEGTRIAPGKKGKYHVGGAKLAIHVNRPITPVAHNAGLCWPRKGFIKKPGIIDIVIGAPIQVANRDASDIIADVENWIENQRFSV